MHCLGEGLACEVRVGQRCHQTSSYDVDKVPEVCLMCWAISQSPQINLIFQRQEVAEAEIVAYLECSGLNSNWSLCKMLPGRPQGTSCRQAPGKGSLLAKDKVIPHCGTLLMAATLRERLCPGSHCQGYSPLWLRRCACRSKPMVTQHQNSGSR